MLQLTNGNAIRYLAFEEVHKYLELMEASNIFYGQFKRPTSLHYCISNESKKFLTQCVFIFTGAEAGRKGKEMKSEQMRSIPFAPPLEGFGEYSALMFVCCIVSNTHIWVNFIEPTSGMLNEAQIMVGYLSITEFVTIIHQKLIFDQVAQSVLPEENKWRTQRMTTRNFSSQASGPELNQSLSSSHSAFAISDPQPLDLSYQMIEQKTELSEKENSRGITTTFSYVLGENTLAQPLNYMNQTETQDSALKHEWGHKIFAFRCGLLHLKNSK
ncbi:hypothetical protein L345_12155, partial [Ophiophagus hannah]